MRPGPNAYSRTLTLLLLVCGATAPVHVEAEQPSTSGYAPPNVIILLADDLGFGQLGAYGSPYIDTPNIDRLAHAGIRFTQAYAGGTVCSPSRVSLLTGRDARLLHGNPAIQLRAEDRTVAHLLRSAGYETALFGKYGVGTEFGVNDPMAMGFSRWYGILDNISAHRQYPTHVFEDNKYQVVSPNIGGAKGVYAQELFTEQAISFLKQERERPFFMVLAFTTPHAELAAPQRFVDVYAGKFAETPYSGMSGPEPRPEFARFYPEPVAQPNATMAAMVTALDAYVGQVVDAIESQGLAENTLILFTSDNGPHAEGGIDPLDLESSGSYRGHKRDLLDGGIHIPMIAAWAGKITPGRVDDTAWSFADVLPTVAALAGVHPSSVPGIQTNGKSVLPILLDEDAGLEDRMIYWEFRRGKSGQDVAQAARRGDWKAVRYGVDAPLQVFNIVDDPGEMEDLGQQYPRLLGEFQALFARHLADGR